MTAGEPIGVAVMAHGTPESRDAVEAFYTRIRRGRPPTPELLADLVRRYEAIGGLSPLGEHTRRQHRRLEAALDRMSPGRFRVRLGQKHVAPFIEDAVAELHDLGCRSVVGLVLAPHHSRAGVGEYARRASDAAAAQGITATTIPSWHLLPEYLDFTATALVAAAARVPPGSRVLFTAHSLPERALVGDPYPEQLTAGAEAAAARAGLPRDRWSIAWQSAGRTPGPWRGPDLLEVIARLGTDPDAPGVIVCPHGFVAEHLEVLYDVDVEARAAAAEAGLAFARTGVLHDDPTVFDALARLVATTADEADS